MFHAYTFGIQKTFHSPNEHLFMDMLSEKEKKDGGLKDNYQDNPSKT